MAGICADILFCQFQRNNLLEHFNISLAIDEIKTSFGAWKAILISCKKLWVYLIEEPTRNW